MQQHGGAYADGKPVDCREQWFRIAHQRVKKIDGNRFESAFGALLKVGNVTAGAERAWTAHKDDAADRIVRRGFEQRACHLRIHGLCQGILLFRTVHPDHTDAVLLRHYDLGHFFLKG